MTLMKQEKLSPPSNAIDRIFRIIEVLSLYEFLSLDQIAHKTNIPISSALRFIQTCVQNGYIEIVENKKYRLSTKLFSLAHTHMERYSPVITHSHTHLQELCYLTKETIHLGILSGATVLYVDKIDSPLVIRLNSYIGYQASVHSTAMGKILLAWLPTHVQSAFIENLELKKFTKNTITSKKKLLLTLEQVRKSAYAEDNEEQEPHLYCLAVPIFNAQNDVVAAVSVSIPTMRYVPSRKQTIIKALRHCAENISKKMNNTNYKHALETAPT